MRKLQFVCALIVCALAVLSAQTLPSGVKKMASMGGITEYDYPNGLRVLLYPDPAEPKITINEKIETPDKANAEFMAQERFQLSQNDLDYPAIVLASYMFGEPITSRISDRIRNREGLSYGANARLVVPTEGDAATLTGTVSLNPGVGPKVEASFMDELKKVYNEGFTQAEVDNAKKALLDARLVGRSTDSALLNFLVQHEQLDRPFKFDADVEAKIQSLTAPEVNAAFRRHIDPNGVSIVKAGDFKAAGVYKQ